MSEPIQSIAQNNYILATQQEVSHDNTLSGTGLANDVLGLSQQYYSGLSTAGSGVCVSSVNSNILMNECRAIKIGNLVTLYGSIDINAAISIASRTWTNVGTVNTDLKPYETIYFPYAASNGTTTIVGNFRIDTNGVLALRQPTTANAYGRTFSITYRGLDNVNSNVSVDLGNNPGFVIDP